jgi:hypothetical protein
MARLAKEERRLAQQFNDASLSTHSDNLYPSCGNSFTAGSLVETENGSVPIEDIEVGDRVLGEDPETGEQGYYEVVALTNHPENELLEVTVETIDDSDGSGDGANVTGEATQEVMEVTAEHPIYVEGKGWLLAENLEVGDELRTADDIWAVVLSVASIQLDEPELVYNFTVKGPHTYFVLNNEVLVHNSSKWPCEYAETAEALDILELYEPTFARRIISDEVSFRDFPNPVHPRAESATGGNSIIFSWDPNYPASSVATLFEEIFHLHQPKTLAWFAEIEAKAAKANWLLKNPDLLRAMNPADLGHHTDLYAYFSGRIQTLGSGNVIINNERGIENLGFWLPENYKRSYGMMPVDNILASYYGDVLRYRPADETFWNVLRKQSGYDRNFWFNLRERKSFGQNFWYELSDSRA